MPSLAPFAIALALACGSCAQTSAEPEPTPGASTPDYAALHRKALEHLAVGEMDAALVLVEDLPQHAPARLEEQHAFTRLRRLADLVQGMRARGITGMTLRMEDSTPPPFESRPRT